MQRVGPLLIVSDDYKCGRDGATFGRSRGASA
jgi:hypothetical protein